MGAHQLRAARALSAAVLALAATGSVVAFERSYIPIPEIITDPNEGNTLGLLGVVLFLDEKDEIRYMLAPDIRYNDTKGVFPTFRFFGYPSPQRRYSIFLGKSTTKDEDYGIDYTDQGFWDGRAFVRASVEHERDSTERFYGFGNDSPESGESNYTDNDTEALATPGVWLLPFANLSYRMRIRRFSVEHGQVDSLPFIAVAHPGVRDRGLDPGVYWAHRVALSYDTRDSTDIPRRGAFATVYVELADRRLGSSTSFVKFGFDWRDYIPLRKGNPIIALRALTDWVSGSADTPFWEMSSLGGRRTLRGYGSDRFIDFNRALASTELRTVVWKRHLFGVNFQLEMAPFVEAGQVFRHVSDSPVSDLHWVGGLGFRGVVRPQIVGFVDVGRGSEGFAVFTGVDYPF